MARLLRTKERAAGAAPLGEALTFMQLLWAVMHGLESTSKRMHATLGITGPQRLALRIIGHHGRISAGQLAEILRVHPSSLTGVLRRLEQARLLRRRSDPDDRRRAVLELTAPGKRLNQRPEGTIEAAVDAALCSLPRAKVAAARVVLKAVASALGDGRP
jgi:DNA-binding MarR family transcriptional regulator